MIGALSPLMRRLAEAIAPDAPIEFGGGGVAVARDELLLQRICAPSAPETFIRPWINDPCLVTTRRLAAHPRFHDACAVSDAAGWPVHVRASGGSTVVHRPGILNVSFLRRMSAGSLRVEEYYAPLIALLSASLGELGVAVTAGKREGSYCDGAFNLLARDRKIAGTSCRVIKSAGRLAHLTHAVVWVEGDVSQDVAAVTRFETALGLNVHYALDCHATLQSAIQSNVKKLVKR